MADFALFQMEDNQTPDIAFKIGEKKWRFVLLLRTGWLE
jgi:hypothetical protein